MTMIEVQAADGPAEAWLGRPDDQPHPGVLLVIDAIGLRPETGRLADRIASWGYVVLAPNLFYRTGSAAELAPDVPLTEPGAREAFFATVGPRVAALTTQNAERDVATYLAELRALPSVAPGPFAVTGYCLGARIAVRAACGHPEDVVACGGFHGGNLVTDQDDSPHLGLAGARASFVFGHADQDPSMGPDSVAALGSALGAAGLEHRNEIYPGSPHGYVMADTSMYDEAGAERHFTELRDLLARTLG